MFSSFSSPYSVSPIIEQGLVSGSCSLFLRHAELTITVILLQWQARVVANSPSAEATRVWMGLFSVLAPRGAADSTPAFEL